MAGSGQAAVSSCTVAVHQPETLPWLGFIDKLRQCDVFVLLDHVQFSKHGFQNRNRIRTLASDGWSWVTVPVLTKGSALQRICDVRVNGDACDWRRKHAASLRQNYCRAPYFERYMHALESFYAREWERLVDFNVVIIEWLARCFGIDRVMVRSSELGVSGVRSELLLTLCQKLGATEYLSGISGLEYLNVGLFESAGVTVRFQEFYHPIYRQCYEPFVPALSSIDLLFNYGADSLDVLEGRGVTRMAEVFK